MVRPADPRTTGAYEQTADWPSHESLYASIAQNVDLRYVLTVTGLVTSPGPLRYSELVALAAIGSDDTFAVPLAELLAAVRLIVSAEVLVVTDLHGGSLAVPVRDAATVDGARLTLGTSKSALRHGTGGPVRLDVPGWTDPSEPFAVASIRALTFEEFLRCS